MRAIMVLFDSLRRDLLPCYGGDIQAPHFARLAARAATFDRFYAGSLPCMPARRELHTGRYNFLHRGWMPLEPFDDSMPELLKKGGVYTHLVTDHYHYWQEGGANYHGRFTTWENVRGQEGDSWKYDIPAPDTALTTMAQIDGPFSALFLQDAVNRAHMNTYDVHPQTRTFDGGVDFIEKHKDAQNWFLQIESFDPHEPFFSSDAYTALYPDDYTGREVDWPQPFQAKEDEGALREHVRNRYRALVSQCDNSLGRVLDLMVRYNMWEDTLLIVNTDHGLLLAEHGWWGKGTMPPYNEIVHLPFFLWDPRYPASAGERCAALAQNIDVAPSLLRFFGLPVPPDMLGRPLETALCGGILHDAVLFGYHGGHVCVTNGRYLYMRAPAAPDNAPPYDYTLTPAAMHERANPALLINMELTPPFSFTKGCSTLKIKKESKGPFGNMYPFGNLLFDLANDPSQERPLSDPVLEKYMQNLLIRLMRENDAPAEQYVRLGLSPLS